MSEIVDRLVVTLGERIDDMQDAESERDFDRIVVLAAALMENAQRAGFADLTGVARALEAASAGCDAEGTHARLVELTEIAHRVRLGHKGSV